MASLPGYFTPSEACAAIEAGATALKLFPAAGASPAVLKAHRAVLPKETRMLAVGGVPPTTMRPWREAGANALGPCSAPSRASDGDDPVAQQANDFVPTIPSASGKREVVGKGETGRGH